MPMEGVLSREIWLLERLLYKMKNQHRSTWVYRKMRHLARLVRRDRALAMECCRELYVLCSSSLAIGHFVSLMAVLMGICARLRVLLGRASEGDEIDEIFAGL